MSFIKSNIKPRFKRFWGQRIWTVPVLVSKKEGDGKQVVYVKTGDSRPAYYVLRIDTKHDLEDEYFDTEFLLGMIEEEFDNVDNYNEVFVDGKYKYFRYGDEDEDEVEFPEFPMLSTGNGYWWGSMKTFK